MKSANAKIKGQQITATFSTSYKQLIESSDGKLIYFLVVRRNDLWDKIIIIERTKLWALYQKVNPSSKKRGKKMPEKIILTLKYRGANLFWKDKNLRAYNKKWDYFNHNAPKIS